MHVSCHSARYNKSKILNAWLDEKAASQSSYFLFDQFEPAKMALEVSALKNDQHVFLSK